MVIFHKYPFLFVARQPKIFYTIGVSNFLQKF